MKFDVSQVDLCVVDIHNAKTPEVESSFLDSMLLRFFKVIVEAKAKIQRSTQKGKKSKGREGIVG